MKKRVLPLLMASCMMASTISPVFGQEQPFMESQDPTFIQETGEPTQDTVVSVTIDGTTTNYSNWKDAFDRKIKGKQIDIKLYQDVDFTNAGIYSKQTQTSGIYLEILDQGANVTLDLNGHNVTNHFKNPNGNKPARGFTATLKKGGKFQVVNTASKTSHFDVERLGQVKGASSTKLVEFSFGDNITTNTKDLDLKYLFSDDLNFYDEYNGGYKALQEDGSYRFYTSASDAIRNSTNKTAVLNNDYTGSDNFAALSGVTGTIDLNGKTFTTKSTVFNFQYSNVDMTIQNGTIHAMSEHFTENGPNVGFMGATKQDVSNIKLTLKDVNIESNYYRGIDMHGTDTNLHLVLDNTTLTMTRDESYGIYIPSQDSSVTIKNNSFIKAGTGIAVKGGTLTVEDSHISSHGQENIPSTGNPSGFEETGDAIYVDGTYKYPIQVNVKNSEVTSEHAQAMRDLFVAQESTQNTTIVAESGQFSSDVMKYVPQDKAAIKVDANYVVGTAQQVKQEVAHAKESVTILQGIDSIQVPGGVTVTNSTGQDVTVNGTIVGQGDQIAIPKPSTGGGSSQKVNLVYRAYNPNNGEHLYTLDEKEYQHVTSVGWHAEGVAFMAETEKKGQALYRVYNPNSGLHHYTTDENEKNVLVSLGWNDEGVAWYTFKPNKETAVVYRVYNPNDGNHHYTMNQQEKDALVSYGWNDEGVAFYSSPISK